MSRETVRQALELHQAGRSSEAEALCRQVLATEPEAIDALHLLALACCAARRFAEGVEHLTRLRGMPPANAAVENDLGTALMGLGRFDDAEAAYRRSLALQPTAATAWNNLGNALRELGKGAESLAAFEEAIRLDPNYAEAYVHRAFNRLARGDFAGGWADYEWRWKSVHGLHRRKQIDLPRWDGQPLDGRGILLYGEQGYGDTLQFVRYARIVKRLGGRITLICAEELVSLLRAVPELERVMSLLTSLEGLDVQAPLLSLPWIVGTTSATIPAEVPYVRADPARAAAWREVLGVGPELKIGIAWQGRPTNIRDRQRSFPLRAMAPLVSAGGVRLFGLQKGVGRDQIAEFADTWPIVDLADRLHDFSDTAAVMSQLDLVVTCDSALAHLAGALGVAVHVALPWVSEWRWLLERADSPWYPTLRLWRQTVAGDWDGVFGRMAAHLLAPPPTGPAVAVN